MGARRRRLSGDGGPVVVAVIELATDVTISYDWPSIVANDEYEVGRENPVQLSMPLSYAGGFAESARQAAELEKVGLDVVWVAEAYGYDAPSFMGYLAAKTERVQIGAAILPIYTRTPTLIAMTAAGIDAISGGRCVLGLGASGPQVIEGFHGVPYDRPLARTREIIQI